jgi:hypothetical protein
MATSPEEGLMRRSWRAGASTLERLLKKSLAAGARCRCLKSRIRRIFAASGAGRTQSPRGLLRSLHSSRSAMHAHPTFFDRPVAPFQDESPVTRFCRTTCYCQKTVCCQETVAGQQNCSHAGDASAADTICSWPSRAPPASVLRAADGAWRRPARIWSTTSCPTRPFANGC